MKKLLFFCLVLFSMLSQNKAQIPSTRVFFSDDDCLQYVSDVLGNFIPDFSYAGYQYGEVPLPELPVVKTIAPVSGDNTEHIQTALDELAQLTPDSNGFRGALLLEAGLYRIEGVLTIGGSGIVLRGVGQAADTLSNTVLLGTGNTPNDRDVVRVGGASGQSDSWTTELSGSKTKVNAFVPAGARTIAVEDISLYEAGDEIIVKHISSEAWLASIDYGATESDDPWTAGTIDMFYCRRVVAVYPDEKKLVLDVPIYDHLDPALAEIQVYKYSRVPIRSQIGIENLRIDIQTAGEEDEQHAKNCIRLLGVEDCWVKDVSTLHFSYAGIDMRVANRVSVIGCTAIEPHSEIRGGRRYNFAVGRFSNNILFQKCYSNRGRHTFVSNGASSVAGVVWHNSTSDTDFSTSEGHRRWSQGLLFDNLSFTNSQTSNLVALYNRGDYGTGHGWSSVHSVAWRVKTPSNRNMVIQQPPGRQNYAIACRTNMNARIPFPDHPAGFVELQYQTPAIGSLYETQLNFRLNNPPLPDAPTRLEAQAVNGNILLSWQDVAADEVGYEVQYKTSEAGAYEVLATLDANTSSYEFIYADTFEMLTYRVSALGVNCRSPYSNPVTIEISTSTLSTDENKLRVYPNPFQEYVSIRSSQNIRSITVHAVSGRILLETQSTNLLTTKNWPPGIYLLTVTDEEGNRSSTKVVKH